MNEKRALFENDTPRCPSDGMKIKVIASAVRAANGMLRYSWCPSCKVLWADRWNEEGSWKVAARIEWSSRPGGWRSSVAKTYPDSLFVPPAYEKGEVARVLEIARAIASPENFR